MKILHTADLHIGQEIYNRYDRADEHDHFFKQLNNWCQTEHPDALIVSGDIFDLQQPSAASKKAFNEHFVRIHTDNPDMHIVITAGNHDSASRIEADSALWNAIGITMVGIAPSLAPENDDWKKRYIIELESGFIIAIPHYIGERTAMLQQLLDYVEERNVEGKPVIMMGHLAVTGSDATGHDFEIGKIKSVPVSALGTGFDYAALGHIHKPQTIGHQEDCFKEETVTYPSGAVRYSGSALHVSCDEAYPHSVSMVEIEKHGGDVSITPLKIEELRHFITLPKEGPSYSSQEEALQGVADYIKTNPESCYFRLRINYAAQTAVAIDNEVYKLLGENDTKYRFNPKIIWTDCPEKEDKGGEMPTFEVAELQQMINPIQFIEKTISQYPGITLDIIQEAFLEIEAEKKRMDEEQLTKALSKTKKKSAPESGNAYNDETREEEVSSKQ